MLSLQYCKLLKQYDEVAEEWIGCLRVKDTEGKYKGKVRRPKEQFINSINDQSMISKNDKELTAIRKTSEAKGEGVLSWSSG